MGEPACVRRGTGEHSASPWWPAAGGGGDVSWERQSGSMSDKAHHNSRVHAADRWERLRRQSIIKVWFLRLVWCEVIVDRMGCPRALASPGAWVGFAPLPAPLDRGRVAKRIPVVRLVMPTALAGGLAGLAADGLGAGALAPSAARVGSKKGLTGLALAFRAWPSHWPVSPPANARKSGAWKAENGEENRAPKPSEANRRRGERSPGGEEDGTA
jgi:hypothetical protein